MKSVDLQKTVMRATDDGISSVTIAQQLQQAASSHTVRRWQDLYRRTGKVDLKNSPGRPRIVRTKHLIQKVKKNGLLIRTDEVQESWASHLVFQ